ncbi:MAG: DMT family transporter [Gammaproteobacteria bacterium]
MTLRFVHWAMLLSLVALWGSSYLMIEIALTVWRPAEIAGLRVATAAVALAVVILLRRERLPSDWRHWRLLAVIAVVGNCLPFFLISWGQQHLESGLAGILAASTPLFVLVLAHFVLDDEPLGRRHIVAFMVGFAGIIVLMGRDSLAALGGSGDRLLAQLAILGAAAGYAVATVMARKLPGASAVVTATGVMLVGTLLMAPYVAAGVGRLGIDSLGAAAAVGFVGILGTGIASIVYFRLVAETGARFTSMLNYLVPVWAVALGAAVLGETLPISAWLGAAMILGALVLVARAGTLPIKNLKKVS